MIYILDLIILLCHFFLHSTGFLQKDLVKDLLKECAKMKEFDHPNVLKLKGVCLDGGPAPYIIMPFITCGRTHLKENRESIILESSTSLEPDLVSMVKRPFLPSQAGYCVPFFYQLLILSFGLDPPSFPYKRIM